MRTVDKANRSYELLKLIVPAASILLLSGCALMNTKVTDGDMSGVDDSMSLASGNITKYDDAMTRLSQMLDAYGAGSVTVQVRTIANRTASKKLPADVTQMTITALNKVGTHVRIIDYDQDQLGIDLALGKHTMQRIAPDLALRGAITEFDKKVEKERSVGVDISGTARGKDFDGGANYDTDADGITAAMDFQLLDYETQVLISGIQAANRINLFSSSKGGGMNLSFIGTGVDFNAKVKKSQGLHASLRLLVELSIAELIGKYNQIPFWRVVPDAPVDKAAVARFRKSLNGRSDLVLLMKQMATAHGATVHAFSDQITDEEAVVFQQMRKQLNLSETSSEKDFITQLWLTVPVEEGAKNMEGYYTRRRQYEEQAAAEAEARAAQRQAEAERLAQEQAEAERLAQEKSAKRTTFKFGAQDSF